MGVPEATFFRRKQNFSGLGPSELRRLRQLEEENTKPRELVADLSLGQAMLQDVLAKKKPDAWSSARTRPARAGRVRGERAVWLGDELPDREIFHSLREAEVLIERWRRHYNMIRPRSCLGYRPPAPEAVLPWPSGAASAPAGPDGQARTWANSLITRGSPARGRSQWPPPQPLAQPATPEPSLLRAPGSGATPPLSASAPRQ